MIKKDVFVVLPYLKTTEPVFLRGIHFRSSDDLEGLEREQKAHLETLFAMFFLRENLRIKRMTYAHLELITYSDFELIEGREGNQKLIWQLYEAQTLINYIYATPHSSTGDPFLSREHTSMYIFTIESVYTGLIWPKDPQVDYNVENMADDELPGDKYINGYQGILNGMLDFWVVLGNRIYPPVPHLSLNISQNLYHDLTEFAGAAKNWAWVDFLRGHKLKTESARDAGNWIWIKPPQEYKHERSELDERLFTAMEWYNRSTAEDVDEDEILLNLAIAFESLLNLENTDKITTRFRETVMTLLGSAPRLDSWLEQFYNARSSVAHKGKAQHYMFYAMNWDRDKLSKVYSGKDPTVLRYRSLTTYGRRIFRLCLSAILSGARIAEDDGLSRLFVHNQERLEKILQQLKQTTEAPEKRLHLIAADVGNLLDHHWDSQGLMQLETMVAVGISVIETYLATTPQFSEEKDTLIQEILHQLRRKDLSADAKIPRFKKVVTLLKQGQDDEVMNQYSLATLQPLSVVLSLLNYVTSLHFNIREYQGRHKSSRPPSP